VTDGTGEFIVEGKKVIGCWDCNKKFSGHIKNFTEKEGIDLKW